MKNNDFLYTTMNSPLGPILLARRLAGLAYIHFQAGTEPFRPPAGWREAPETFGEAVEQLEAYFRGELRRFELPLAPEGTPFQHQVWQVMQSIPYGRTLSYQRLAQRIGRPGAARAVGGASSRNPLPVVVPCHRVVGSDGSLTGYAGGLEIKRALLALERGQRFLQA